ncbi:MAG: putative DNA binding domain-containing protein [Planctomycetes bacterium]|nr:putative DNA binding domain-containing protein [Planctomycetota bacterium]
MRQPAPRRRLPRSQYWYPGGRVNVAQTSPQAAPRPGAGPEGVEGTLTPRGAMPKMHLMHQPPDLEALLADLESFRVERTQSLTDSGKFCKAICAFANDMPDSGLPGYLFVGVDQNGKPTGATIDERLLEALAGHRDNGNIIPIPTMQVFKAEHEGADIAVVEVLPSDMPPVRYKQTVWIRTGPSADRATLEQERRLEERRVDRARTWDLRACPESSLDDLALELFTVNYLPSAVTRDVLDENARTHEEQLGSLRFYHAKLHAPTNAAVLLFGKDPLSFFPGAYVQYVKYDGPTQADTPLREHRIAGDLFNVLRDLDRLARDLANQRPVRRADLAEDLVADYPDIALRELFINAVIHRNYDGSTTPVSINHFSDRIEIQNPGSLYGDLTKEQFPDGTAYRNPVLAEAAKTLGFANRFGRGIALAKSHLEKNESPPLEYFIGENHLAMIVRKRP